MATNTYVVLDKITLSTAASTITFSSIPQTYTDLVIVFNGTAATATYTGLQFNGDTGSNYSYTQVHGNGTSALSGRSSNATELYTSSSNTVTTTPSVMIVNIQNYANTTTNKTALIRNSNSAVEAAAAVGMWRNTAAITSVTIKTPGTNFAVGSTFSLYGIAASSVGAKATGGIISSDSQYYYHTFLSSETFTPTQSISADVLCVAGGGGGGSYRGGGGGAGGLLVFTSQSLTATGYAVTVGAGGAGGASAGAVNGNYGTQGGNSQFGSLTASVGGGFGAKSQSISTTYLGGNGGSGGGSTPNNTTNISGGSATSGQGYAGGGATTAETYNKYGAGSGGGAGGAGNPGLNTGGGAGGIGATSTFINAIGSATGFGQLSSGNYYFAGGGAGGAIFSAPTSLGGLGGGGSSPTNSNGSAGTINTGGGGGGSNSTDDTTTLAGGAGGSGIIIIRYPKA